MSAGDPAARTVVLPICPVAAPRQSRRDAWDPSPAVARYRAFRDEVRLAARAAGYELGPVLRVRFELPMPASWSGAKRRRLGGTPHRQTPDVDNLVKALADSLTDDDAFVWRVEAEKVWGDTGAIVVWREEEDGDGR